MSYRWNEHELSLQHKDAAILVDHQPRGGLLIQVCTLSGGGGEDWNCIRLPRRMVAELREFLAPPKPKRRKGGGKP